MKTRMDRRTRLVPHTRNGHTEMVEEAYEVPVPVEPQDWDAIAFNFVMTATTLAILGVVVWSSVAIGDLLSRIAPEWAAYSVAGIYDMAWICCMVLTWIARYDRDRARIPMICSWMALGLSMALIAVHGYVVGYLWVGIAGACVSLVVKSLWGVVMGFNSVELDPKDVAFMKQRRAAIALGLADVAGQRQLERAQDKILAQRLALGVPTRTELSKGDRTDGPDNRTDGPDNRTDGQSIAAFVRGLLSKDPDMSREQVLSIALPALGMDPKTREAVRKAYARNKPKHTV